MSRTRGPSKAQQIIADAKERMESTEKERDIKRAEADRAQIIYESRVDVYNSLRISLAPKPRGNGTGKSPSPAPPVVKKSPRQKSLPTATVANTEVETVNATTAGGSGD
jgi:hypothetical protein